VRIVVNHVTRMSNSRICVAGIDADTFNHIRPTTPPTDPITRELLREHGGPFGIGALVDLGPVQPRPIVPEIEDHRFVTTSARRLGDLTDDDYLTVLDRVSAASLEHAFGPDLERVKERRYAIDAGRGTRSLAVVRLRGRSRLHVTPWGRLRLQLRYPDGAAYLSMTDVRFYESDQTTIRHDVVTAVNRRLGWGVDTFVMLGLARAFVADGDDRCRHWLQANGLCLADRPVGDLP
jgi:hypothetical protein